MAVVFNFSSVKKKKTKDSAHIIVSFFQPKSLGSRLTVVEEVTFFKHSPSFKREKVTIGKTDYIVVL